MLNAKVKQMTSKITVGVVAATMGFMLIANLPAAVKPVNADSGVAINSNNFPDEKFRKYVAEECDENRNNYLSDEEINGVTAINVWDYSISSLKGIEYFTALEELDCSDNQITSLDVSKNTALTTLYCTHNKLTNLNVSNCPGLRILYCNYNQLTSLDVSRNNALDWLDCSCNNLTSLILTKSLGCSLEILRCYDNKLTKVNISTHGVLMELYYAGENITDRREELPDSAILYRNIYNYELAVDRTTIIYTNSLEPGWYECDGIWSYVEENGDFAYGWKKINGSWYYFDCLYDLDDPYWPMHTGWLEDGGVWYYLTDSGAMATGWQRVNGVWYYFDNNGKMATGWRSIGGVYYYFKSSGAMAANEYCEGYWLSASGAWTYKYKATWKKDSTGWWYGDDTGWYAKNESVKIDGKVYNFNAAGYCTNP